MAIPSNHGRAESAAGSKAARLRNATRNVSLRTSSTASRPILRRVHPPTIAAWRSKICAKSAGSEIEREMMSLSVFTLCIPPLPDRSSIFDKANDYLSRLAKKAAALRNHS